MITIPVRGRVKPDGTLVVSVATGMPESEVEVLVVVNRLSSGTPADQFKTWPEGFFERTYGACASGPLCRAPQGEFEVRGILQ
jgi:hypothetical protein